MSSSIPSLLPQYETNPAAGPSVHVDDRQSLQPVFEQQILLVLCGLPGSGKSTFAEALVSLSEQGPNRISPFSIHTSTSTSKLRRRWIRASQDEAPNRKRQECEARVRWGLRQGCNVVVDRVDFDPQQRSHFISIAKSHIPRPRIYCLVLSVSTPTLQARLISRPTHPTIPDSETGLRVLQQMIKLYKPPIPINDSDVDIDKVDKEGFDKVYILEEKDQPVISVWSEKDLWRILDAFDLPN